MFRARLRSLLAAAACLVVVGASAACSSAADSTATTTSPVAATGTTAAVTKDVLAEQVDPPGAPGRTLTLIRYTIAPGATLSPHVHPGVQLAEIESGALTYTVVSGAARVTRGNGDVAEITGPDTVTLDPGDAVNEVGDMVHFGANETDAPVVIIATLLTESDEDLAVTVTTVAAPDRKKSQP